LPSGQGLFNNLWKTSSGDAHHRSTIWISTSVQMMILVMARQNRRSASSMNNTPPAETRWNKQDK
jgi:hypothetical protein